MAEADPAELEKYIHSTGFYKNKAKNIIACCKKLVSDFAGQVPRPWRNSHPWQVWDGKTANVIRGNIYDEPSIVVDTHVKRISNKLGFTKETDPQKIEFDLMKKCFRKIIGFYITYR